MTATTPDSFDPHDLGFLADPYPTYAMFRSERPVARVEPYNSHWAFRHEDCRTILDTDDLFAKNPPPDSEPGTLGHHKITQPPPQPFAALGGLPTGMFMADPPWHDELRRMVEPLFGRAISGAGQVAETMAEQRIADLAGTTVFELVSTFALPVPSSTLFTVLGIPDDPEHRTWSIFTNWISVVEAAHDVLAPPQVVAQAGTVDMALSTFLEGYINQLIAMEQPPPGVLTELIAGMADEPQLSPLDIRVSCVDFVVAGYLSTTYLIGTGILNLLANPAQLDRLRSQPDLMDQAVLEMLRMDAPFQLVDRFVTAPTELGGQQLRVGDSVTAVVGSADRDPAVFHDPDRFLLDRDPQDQLAFGFGIHRCIGAPMALQVMPAAMHALLSLPDLRRVPDSPPIWHVDPYLRGPTILMLQYG